MPRKRADGRYKGRGDRGEREFMAKGGEEKRWMVEGKKRGKEGAIHGQPRPLRLCLLGNRVSCKGSLVQSSYKCTRATLLLRPLLPGTAFCVSRNVCEWRSDGVQNDLVSGGDESVA